MQKRLSKPISFADIIIDKFWNKFNLNSNGFMPDIQNWWKTKYMFPYLVGFHAVNEAPNANITQLMSYKC